MTRRGNEAEPEAFEIIECILQRVDFQLAAITGAGIDLADRERAAKATPGCTVNAPCQFGKRRIVDRRRRFGHGFLQQLLKNELAHAGFLEIVPRIGAVERLITEWKVGHDIAFDRGLQQRPLKPGWVA